MEETLKMLFSSEMEKISKKEVGEIQKALQSLREKATIGERYREELKSEVLRLSAALQPELEIGVMKSICEKVSVEELKSLKKAFKTKLSKILPAKPQFSPEKPELSGSENTQFKR